MGDSEWDKKYTEQQKERLDKICRAEGFGVVVQWLREAWVAALVEDGMTREGARRLVEGEAGEWDNDV